MPRIGLYLVVLVAAYIPGVVAGFTSHKLTCTDAGSLTPRSLQRNMIPIRTFQDDFNFLARSDEYRRCMDSQGTFGEYELSVVEESDLPEVARFVVQSFGADVITLSQDLGSFKRMIMQPAIELVNGYSGIVAFAEVLAGTSSRMRFRLQSPSEVNLSPPNLNGLSRDKQIVQFAGSSLILALAKSRDSNESIWSSEVIGSIELRLQPCDAKIPFSLPWIDRIERRIASFLGFETTNTRDLQPYLSNLCVDEKFRGKGIGQALVRCVEDITRSNWGYSLMYLHVDPENEAAVNLYKNEGYRDVGKRWNPFWAGEAAKICYFVKNLNPDIETIVDS